MIKLIIWQIKCSTSVIHLRKRNELVTFLTIYACRVFIFSVMTRKINMMNKISIRSRSSCIMRSKVLTIKKFIFKMFNCFEISLKAIKFNCCGSKSSFYFILMTFHFEILRLKFLSFIFKNHWKKTYWKTCKFWCK